MLTHGCAEGPRPGGRTLPLVFHRNHTDNHIEIMVGPQGGRGERPADACCCASAGSTVASAARRRGFAAGGNGDCALWRATEAIDYLNELPAKTHADLLSEGTIA